MPRMSLIRVNAHTTGRCHAETFGTQRVDFNLLHTSVYAGAGAGAGAGAAAAAGIIAYR